MIELCDNELVFSFPDVHEAARLRINFQRTLRIPDDGRNYPLPAGLGKFPLRHVDDFASALTHEWIEHGGVMLPMYQSEALWVDFEPEYDPVRDVDYPFAVKIATGKINAVTGEEWKDGINRCPQDYLIVPRQPWIDGYCVDNGVIRQFVAMPLGSGYSVEEQITAKAEFGGLQLLVRPMKREVYEKRFPKRERMYAGLNRQYFIYDREPGMVRESQMGLAPGGRMKQEIYEDPYEVSDWHTEEKSRCFVHIANSMTWRAITGQEPPATPVTAREYERAGVPWFDWYNERNEALSGSEALEKTKSVAALAEEKKDVPLPENRSMPHDNVVVLRKHLKPGQIREWRAE